MKGLASPSNKSNAELYERTLPWGRQKDQGNTKGE